MIYDVRIEQLDLMALFDLKGSRAALGEWCGAELPDFPDQPTRYTVRNGTELMFLGPEQWILRAPLDMEAPLIEALRPEQAPDDISIVRISDTLTFFSVSGPDMREVMAIASPLDIDAEVFPGNAAALSEVFSVKALILRTGDAFHLGVDRSFGPMIADYLARATAA